MVGASLLVALLASASPASAQQRVWKQFGDQTRVEFGYDMDRLGDITGDGIADVIVGARGESTSGQNNGMVALHSGSDGSPLLQLYGGTNEVLFGKSVSRMGDVDGDGIPDFAVGSLEKVTSTWTTGALTAYSGSSGATLWRITKPCCNSFADELADCGDLNGDGVDDLLVGTWWSTSAMILSGTDGSLIRTITTPSTSPWSFGAAVAVGGDVDGDGTPDVMVGDPYDSTVAYQSGAAFVFSGVDGHPLFSIYGPNYSSRMGQGLAILGDVNGDGFDDFGAGAPLDYTSRWGSTDGGFAVVASGKDGSTLYTYAPDRPNTDEWQIGSSLAPIGDLNRDGFDDFLVGATGAGDYWSAGSVFLYSGRDGGLLYWYEDNDSVYHNDWFGQVVAAAGDVDGDGNADFAVTAPDEGSSTVPICGSLSVWTGDDLFLNCDPKLVRQYDTVTLSVGQGVAAQPYAIFLVDMNGTPQFTLLSFGALDASGRGSMTGFYPTKIGPITLAVRAFALDASNHLIDSQPETIDLE